MKNCPQCVSMKMRKFFIPIIILVAVALAVGKYVRDEYFPSSSDVSSSEPSKLEHLTKDTFEASIQSGIVLVEFWASWCGACRMQAHIIEKTIPNLPAGSKIGKVNVDEERALAQKFNVSSIPTWIVFKDGKSVYSVSGVQSKETLLKLAEGKID